MTSDSSVKQVAVSWLPGPLLMPLLGTLKTPRSHTTRPQVYATAFSCASYTSPCTFREP